MKTVLAALFLLLLTSSLWGQSDDLALAKRHSQLADSFGIATNFDKAILYRNKALNIFQNQRPVPFEEVVKCYRTIGFYYRKWGKLKDSETYQRRAVELAEQRLPADHLELAKAYNSYGSFFQSQGNFDASLSWFSKALTIGLRKKYPDLGDYYNNIGIAHESKGEYEAAMRNYRAALKFNLEKFGLFHTKTSNNYLNLGTLNSNLNRFDAALACFDTTRQIYERLLQPEDANFAELYNNIGAIYTDKGDYRKALESLNKALKIYEKTLGPNHPDVANAFANNGILLLERGDPERALDYFQKAYALRAEALGQNHPLLARTCKYLGNCYLQKKDYDSAETWLGKALAIYQRTFSADPTEIADAHNDMGLYFESLDNYREALSHYEEALTLNRNTGNGDNSNLADSYERIGNLHFVRGNQAQAQDFLYKALNIRLQIFGRKHPEVADAYRRLALVCKNDQVCALEYCDSAFAAVSYVPKLPADFSEISSPVTLLEILQTKGDLLRSFADSVLTSIPQTSNLKPHPSPLTPQLSKAATGFLLDADRMHLLGMELIDFIKNTIEEPGSRQSLFERYYLMYENAIAVKCQLKELTGNEFYWHEAFVITERSNATLLLEALQTVEAERFAGIPDSLLEKERRLKIDLSFLEKQRFEEELKFRPSPAVVNDLSNRIFGLQQKIGSLKEQFRAQYPRYFELKYAPKTVSVADVQRKLLRPTQTMLAYFTGDRRVYAFIISKNDFRVMSISKDFPLEAWVEEFRNSIDRFNPASKEIKYQSQKYANLANELYTLVFQPVEPFLKNTELVIVPGGVLGYLPFDALLSRPAEKDGDFARHPYLLRKYQISYTYSATLLQEMMRPRWFQNRGFIAFAPSFHGDTLNLRSNPWRTVLSSLKYNKSEVSAIRGIMGGQIFLDSSATEERFLKEAPGAGIIHLATHGKSNDRHGDYSYIAFYEHPDSIENELLFVKNLYDLRISAALVVLSACETGIGELQRGEGIVSLARGFSFAGAASIVTTLWSIDDSASANIMVAFYKSLKKGKTKDAALRSAKLEYLEWRQNNENLCHPLFWAAFTPVGNMEPISGDFAWGKWLVFGLVALGSVLYFRQKSK